jgi:hypothetical protein
MLYAAVQYCMLRTVLHIRMHPIPSTCGRANILVIALYLTGTLIGDAPGECP